MYSFRQVYGVASVNRSTSERSISITEVLAGSPGRLLTATHGSALSLLKVERRLNPGSQSAKTLLSPMSIEGKLLQLQSARRMFNLDLFYVVLFLCYSC